MRHINCISLFTFAILLSVAGDVFGCIVSTTPVNFGAYDTYNTLDATGNISVTCDAGSPYTIRIDPGSNSGGSFSRMLRSASGSTLNYNFYRDSARTEVWGDGTNSSFVMAGAGTGAMEHFIIYGRIPGGQKVTSGAFNDTLTIMIEW